MVKGQERVIGDPSSNPCKNLHYMIYPKKKKKKHALHVKKQKTFGV